MELLIPGLILVALMVYASTRIKRSAARAFEAESIETDEFAIEKPDGFLTVIGGDPKYAFEAYSREYGTSGAENIRAAFVTVRVDDNRSVEHIVADRVGSDVQVVSDVTEVVDGTRYRVIEAELVKDGFRFSIVHKLAARGDRVYDLKIEKLAETTQTIVRNIGTMLNSFRLK